MKFLWTKGFLTKDAAFHRCKISLQVDSVIGQRTKASKWYNIITSKRRIFPSITPNIMHSNMPPFFFFWWKKKSALFRKAATWEDGRLATPKPSPNMPYILELVFHKGVFKNRHFKLFFQGHYTLNMLSLCSYL